MAILILEGVDGTGKTTLARKLVDMAKELKLAKRVHYMHFGPPEKHPLEEYECAVQHLHPVDDLAIIDRFHLGMPTYGPIYRGRDELAGPGMRHMLLFLQRHGAVTIRIKRPIEEVMEDVRRRGDDYVRTDDLPVIDKAYDSQPVDATLEGFVTDQDKQEWMLRFAMNMGYCVRKLYDFTTYIGGTAPKALLLGDTRGGPTPHNQCFVPYPNTSGHFLFTHLDPAGYGLANAKEEPVYELWSALGQPPIVALGAEAAKICISQAVPYKKVPHPQYVRRFHHGEGREYAARIIAASS
jgi:hypothetical protein